MEAKHTDRRSTVETATDTRQQQADYSRAYRDAIEIALATSVDARILPPLNENEWSGWDFEIPFPHVVGEAPQILRITPVDGEWDAGCNIYVIEGRGRYLAREAKVSRLSSSATAAIAVALLKG